MWHANKQRGVEVLVCQLHLTWEIKLLLLIAQTRKNSYLSYNASSSLERVTLMARSFSLLICWDTWGQGGGVVKTQSCGCCCCKESDLTYIISVHTKARIHTKNSKSDNCCVVCSHSFGLMLWNICRNTKNNIYLLLTYKINFIAIINQICCQLLPQWLSRKR